jgi:hypothetical protein
MSADCTVHLMWPLDTLQFLSPWETPSCCSSLSLYPQKTRAHWSKTYQSLALTLHCSVLHCLCHHMLTSWTRPVASEMGKHCTPSRSLSPPWILCKQQPWWALSPIHILCAATGSTCELVHVTGDKTWHLKYYCMIRNKLPKHPRIKTCECHNQRLKTMLTCCSDAKGIIH